MPVGGPWLGVCAWLDTLLSLFQRNNIVHIYLFIHWVRDNYIITAFSSGTDVVDVLLLLSRLSISHR